MHTYSIILIVFKSIPMITNQLLKPDTQLQIQFDFINFKRSIKLTVSPRLTITSLRPLFASKFNSDFAHLPIRVSGKGGKKDKIDTETPLYQLDYFSLFREPLYILEVELEYEGG